MTYKTWLVDIKPVRFLDWRNPNFNSTCLGTQVADGNTSDLKYFWLEPDKSRLNTKKKPKYLKKKPLPKGIAYP